jgi:hypothetical protein
MRLARIEQERATRLADEVAAWRLGRDAGHYIAALRDRLDQLDADERERIAAWCDWAEAWCRRTDPVRNPAVIRGLEEP